MGLPPRMMSAVSSMEYSAWSPEELRKETANSDCRPPRDSFSRAVLAARVTLFIWVEGSGMRMHCRGLGLVLVLLTVWGTCFGYARSAELVKVGTTLCDVKLQGAIGPGDFKKLKDRLEWGTRLCLNSPGGSYLDGIELFEHIAASSITTAVEALDVCYSACAIAFMGGSDRAEISRLPNRTLHAKGLLGFHSPFLRREADLGLPGDNKLQIGVALGISMVAKLIRADNYKLLPRLLIADMLETPPSSMYDVDTFRKAHDLDIKLAGIRAPEKITKAMLLQACNNRDPWTGNDVGPQDVKDSQLGVIDKGNNYRIIFGMFGHRMMEKCAVDVVSKPGGDAKYTLISAQRSFSNRVHIGKHCRYGICIRRRERLRILRSSGVANSDQARHRTFAAMVLQAALVHGWTASAPL